MVMLFDSSAWIEFFSGTESSKRVEEVLKSEENYTCIVTIAEVANWCLKNNLENKILAYVQGIVNGSTILDLNIQIVTAAGRLNYERKKTIKNWGMMDSIILSTSLFYDLKILTKDPQFNDLSSIEML